MKSRLAASTRAIRAARLAYIDGFLSRCSGGDFLEIGCETTKRWTVGRHDPRLLVRTNISENELARSMAGARQSPGSAFALLDAHNLPFRAGSFDAVFGGHILHHLDYDRALSEIRRVLRPGGVLVFVEPMDCNPVGWLVRALTPEERTPDEQPIRPRHLRTFHHHFDCTFRFEQLVTVPAALLASWVPERVARVVMTVAVSSDAVLLRIPGLRLLARQVVIAGAPRRDDGVPSAGHAEVTQAPARPPPRLDREEASHG